MDHFQRVFFGRPKTLDFFGILAKVFRQCCRNCILRVQRNILRKRILCKNYQFSINFEIWTEVWGKKLWKKYSFIVIFRFWAKNFRILNQKFPAELFKMHFSCPQDHFDEKHSEKKLYFLDFERNFLELLAKNFRQGFQNCVLRLETNVLSFSKKSKCERNIV